jgi:hypothetical protein
MSIPEAGLPLKKPNTLTRKITFDFKDLFKALAAGGTHAVTAKWEELPKDVVDLGAALGVSASPEERAFLLIRRSLSRAVFELVRETTALDLQGVQGAKGDITQTLNALITDAEVTIDDSFFHVRRTFQWFPTYNTCSRLGWDFTGYRPSRPPPLPSDCRPTLPTR